MSNQEIRTGNSSAFNFLNNLLEDCVVDKKLCQLEGSDCGGRDRRPSWHWRALSILNWMVVFQLADFWAPAPPSTRRIIHLAANESTTFCDYLDKLTLGDGK